MTFYLIKSAKRAALYDTSNSVVKFQDRSVSLAGNKVYTPGDQIMVDGERFDVLIPNAANIPELFRRNTQVIHPSDYAYMIFRSGITMNSRVLESGVGAGSLSAAILWVLSGGELVSVDNNPESLKNARDNVSPFFQERKWTLVEGDVRALNVPGQFDAVFLDIPDPWNALGNLSGYMKRGSTIITYSPNFNQVEDTVSVMEESGYLHLETCELIKRNILVRKGHTRPDNRMVGHTGFITVAIRK
ncbi:MAG: methyltransferase domain-containing protein [Candidatus Thermoplasmatota archaeon]|jgi:tRNA (adenine57-N1/adenine58-N1)-methyltransferase|nr:methyltransferase domain-containing protein [Candidatus Thermoplasmatota archaeon]MCL5800080.1 methyltransferase domain-containing protein [Candidatus Thermoplasmatota archaeon]